MQKTIRNLLLIAITIFVCNIGKVDAENISVEYVDSNGISAVTCYEKAVGGSVCHVGQETTVYFYGIDEQDYRKIETAPNTICLVNSNESGHSISIYDRACSEVEGWDTAYKQTLTKQIPTNDMTCRFTIPVSNDPIVFKYNDSSTILSTEFIISRYDQRKIIFNFDGSSCQDTSGITFNGCKSPLYCHCEENCDTYYGDMRVSLSFEKKEGYDDCYNFSHLISTCIGEGCAHLNDDNAQQGGTSNCDIFGKRLTDILKQIIDLIQIAIPVVIIILTIVDFVGIVLSGEEKNFKAAGNKFVKRIIIGVAVIFLPMLLAFIIDLSGALVPYGIERNQLFCSLF